MKNRPGVAPICISQKSHASLKAHDAPEQPQAAPQLHAVALLEAINASAGVYQLLLASKERMALRADIDAQFLLRRAGLKSLAAYATDDRLAVLRMYALFHGSHLTFKYAAGRIASQQTASIIIPQLDCVCNSNLYFHN